MSDLPASITVREVGPREGFQIERASIPTDDKVRLIDALSETGVTEIEVVSFVRPDRVPQMADAAEVVSRIHRKPGVAYFGVYLNAAGFQRASATGKLDPWPILEASASEAFSMRNNNLTTEEALRAAAERLVMFKAAGLDHTTLAVTASFGCNFEGDVPLERVVGLFERLVTMTREHGMSVERILLADTMGWANPIQVKRTVAAVRERWPETPVGMHLHDTRGLGIANAFAGLEMGVDYFDTAVGGMGGCPFAGHLGAAGNVATEDFLLLCQEIGVHTGVDLDAMIRCAIMAEEIVGHALPGKAKTGGNLCAFRNRA
ncbi:MAG: hydroxymethylglutaryl-CoA lyase [Dehalococcoidia bacterium]|nr:hydroxymethylglutaryl-CoA lyase [Dehalococcoidia bacterium]